VEKVELAGLDAGIAVTEQGQIAGGIQYHRGHSHP
jgi:hypothetical protein